MVENRTPERPKTLVLLRVALRALFRPRLLLALLSAGWRFRRRDWFKRPPFLPVPPSDYMRWRMHTAFGNEPGALTADDLEAYVLWSARMRRH
jgi:hypothetical protein